VTPEGIVSVEIEKSGYRVPTPEQFRLGIHAIEESVAFLLELCVRRTIGVPDERTPEFPYRVLERIVAFIRGSDDDPPAAIAGLGTLLLMTKAPARSIRPIIGRYAEQRAAGKEPFSALQAVVTEERPRIEAHLKSALAIVDGIEEMHAGRGMSERAASYLCDQYRRAFARRVQDPLFDLGPLLSGTIDEPALLDHLRGLYRDFPPCDFLIEEQNETTGQVERTLVTAQPPGQDAKGFEPSQYLRSFQAQQEYVLAHLGPKGFRPSSDVRRRCPYFDACDHTIRTEAEARCASAPWEHVQREGPGCWYSSGVWATLGLVEVHRR
jgi:hypothetical protein